MNVFQFKFTLSHFINRKGKSAMNSKRKAAALYVLVALITMAANVAAQDDLTGTWLIKATNTTFGISFEWARQGNDYADTMMLFAFDSTGKFIGRVRVRSRITLIGQDSLTQTWEADFISPTGVVSPNASQGTGRGSRIRLQTVTAVNESPRHAPISFELLQNYPNPFNPSTTIRFEVAKATYVNLKVLDSLGREVRTLVDRSYGPGSYFQVWDGKDNRNISAPSGTYFLRMNAGAYVDTKKMTLIK
ncbi:hypothetical protein DCC62_26450 [candidate division KSB1 bacterium]|nr:MAG: hypothetical protein DCC62_26450 [candidate division KSB1 bacterium]